MNWLAPRIIKHKYLVLTIFIVITVLSLLLSRLVNVNYDLLDYLPEDSPSTIALDVMTEAFDTEPANLRVMAANVDIAGALAIKEQIEAVEAVEAVYWLDDTVNVYQPLDAIPEDTLETWYKDGSALFSVLIDDGEGLDEGLSRIREIIGVEGAMSGDAVNYSQSSNSSDISRMLLFLIPIIIVILLISTSSWFEPVLFLAAIGISIVINNGTNAFLGSVSFLTQSTASVLQLAVSMDYSIFLLHRFAEERHRGLDVRPAMIEAMKGSFSSILSSGLTTVIGFAALTVMQFRIGPDLGIVLAKGVIFSMLSVMLLLPVLTVLTYRVIDKTQHRSFLPSFGKFAKFVMRVRIPVLILVGLIIVPSFLAQRNNSFIYGTSAKTNIEESETGREKTMIDSLFGESNQMVLMVPEGDLPQEKMLEDALLDLPYITSIISYNSSVSNEIPQEIVPEETLSQLISGGYSRMIVSVSTAEEGEAAFSTVEAIRNTAGEYYGEYYLTGGNSNTYDLKSTVTEDTKLVMLVSIIAVGLVILLIFRSLSFPLILLLTIESAIWLNFSFPYFAGENLTYLGYIIISAVQLGSTVDYAILFATRYREYRESLPKTAAVMQTLKATTGSILTSASILAVAGFIMGKVSTTGVIGELGVLIARGTLLSAFMVLFLLPALLMLCDWIIQKTTFGCHFLKEEIQNEEVR